MRLTLRRTAPPVLPGVTGPARLARAEAGHQDPPQATRALARRLQPGDVAVIDHLDLDRVSAEALVAAAPGAVVNVRPSLSGRHPAAGAGLLLAAGLPVVDDVGPALLADLRDGRPVRVHEEAVLAAGEDGRVLATGQPLTREQVEGATVAARSGMAARLEAIGADTAQVVRLHESLLLEGLGLPDLTDRVAGRPVLVVAPGEQAAADLKALRPFLRDRRPVLVGADGGGALLAAAGLRPDVLVGDSGALPGKATAGAFVLPRSELPRGFAATDLAVLMACSADARVVVLAGSPLSYDEMLDRDRQVAASALAARLRAGGRLVDAQAVASLQRRRPGPWLSWLLLLVALAAVAAAVLSTPYGTDLLDRLRSTGWFG